MMNRRDFLRGLAALAGSAAWMRTVSARTPDASQGVQLAAAWQAAQGYQVGILRYADGLAITARLDIPTRAHDLLLEPAGTLLAVARRPGDWMLRWDREGKALNWRWIEPRRAFAGHVLASLDGRTVYTTELDLDSGMGLIGVRQAASLEKLDEWPTHGPDPHMLTWDATRPGCLIVANGGVPTQPETGRRKLDLHRMDSSIVRLDGATGERRGQWRLEDPRLSLRHLAWNGSRLGIALQAEHDDAEAKAHAPVLAVFDGHCLRTVGASIPLAGYGGSIAALGEGFAVSCPRRQGVAIFGVQGFRAWVELAEACPLANGRGRLWAGGGEWMLAVAPDARQADENRLSGIRLDNHWIALG